MLFIICLLLNEITHNEFCVLLKFTKDLLLWKLITYKLKKFNNEDFEAYILICNPQMSFVDHWWKLNPVFKSYSVSGF